MTKEYIDDRIDKLPKENRQNVLNVIKKYGSNKWWRSDDPLEVAMYQIFEPTLMVNFGKFHEGIEKLLDRPVWTHEMGLNYKGLQEEARLAIKRLKMRVGISDEQRAESIKRSIQMLEDYCKKTGKPLIKIESTKEKTDRDKNRNDISGYDGWLKQN